MELVKKQYRRVRQSKSAFQVGSFGLVGVINTVVDFAVFNVSTLALGVPVVPANIISTSVAQMGSFLMNRHLVFRHQKAKLQLRTVVNFLLVTMVGLYVIQGIVIYTLVHPLPLPGIAAISFLKSLGMENINHDAVIANVAKLIATVLSAVWNFVLYKKVVFGPKQQQ